MTSRIKLILFVVAWISCGILAAGFLNATFRASVPDLIQSPREAARNERIAIAIGIAIGPVALAAAAVVTGLFYDGWTLRADPAPCRKDPEIWCK